MSRLFFLFLLLFSICNLFAQPGKQGVLTVNSNNTIVNEYTALTQDAQTGDNSINTANSTLNIKNRFNSTLSAGDLLFIIQLQGAEIRTNVYDSTWGTIIDYHNCGKNELDEVLSISGNKITLVNPLKNSYTASGHTQIVRVPRYSSLTVDNNGLITADIWNGITGGIIVIEVSGNLTINATGNIDVSGKGFRPGALDMDANSFVTTFCSYYSGDGGEKGEGIAGFEADYDKLCGRYCRGAAANGGGGGDAHNAAGGGGANGGSLNDYTGNGNPDICNPSWITAWNLESNNFAYSKSSGGGRGGYSYSLAVADPLTIPPGSSRWNSSNGDSRRNVGGKGGRPLDYSSGHLFFGGGGGAGDKNQITTVTGPGGFGGGLAYVICNGNILGDGSISANGYDGYSITNEPIWTDGPSGAGAGGTIFVNCSGNISGQIKLNAAGGIGGIQFYTPPSSHPSEAEGGAGGGSGGYIILSNGSPQCNVKGGANGITNSQTMVNFPPNGGTMGGDGSIIILKTCSNQPIFYNDFAEISPIKLIGSAWQNYKSIRLTDTHNNLSGAMWYPVLLPIDEGFTTTFDFKFTEGNNFKCDENSLPGADGIAFVIQNSSKNAIGFMGGGIGYESIKNSLAVEFDTFANDSLQIENYFDPNGNHVAIQSLGTKPNIAKHSPDAMLGMATNILPIKPDGTVYHVKIEYNIEPGKFNIYLDTNNFFGNPIISLSGFNLANTINLENGSYAFLGFTAGTGYASENHDILNWHICLNSAKIPVDVSDEIHSICESIKFEACPNPADDKVDFRFSSTVGIHIRIEIIDILGNVCAVLFDDLVQKEINTINFNTSSLSAGNYICRIKAGEIQKNILLRIVR